MTARDLLAKDKDLRDKLASVTQAEWFEQALAYVKTDIFSRDGLNADHLKGARMFEETLLAIAAPEATEDEQISPGLVHNFDPKLDDNKKAEKTK